MPNVHLHRPEVGTKLRCGSRHKVGLALRVFAQAVIDMDCRGPAPGRDS